MNNEQANLGGDRFQPVAFDNNDLRPTGRPGDGNGLAEVENNGEINEESETELAAETGQSNSGKIVYDPVINPDDWDILGTGRPANRQAGVRDRQTVPALDSGKRQTEPVQTTKSLPTGNKGLAPACTDWTAVCPVLESWRHKDGQPPLPRNFSAVPHLRTVYNRVMPDGGTVITETLTGWQIQWSTACPVCQKRFRPVAGFVPLRTIQRMQELEENERREIIENIIRARFKSGSISDRHSDCAY